MGKFSFKKGGDDDEDSGRRALFGSRSKNKSAAPPSQNPYAQAAIPADPYTKAKMNAGILPSNDQGGSDTRGGFRPGHPAQGVSGGGLPGPGQQRPGNSRENSYAGGPSKLGGDKKNGQSQGGNSGTGYGPEKFGNQGGYGGGASGDNPYSSIQQPLGTSRQGGYGGLGSINAPDTDSNRNELFGGARERVEQRQQNRPSGPPDYQYKPENEAGNKSYGAYGDRQLTAEEEEEEDIQATKQELKFVKQQDVSSTRNALRIAAGKFAFPVIILLLPRTG
jgi:hypothetical protein